MFQEYSQPLTLFMRESNFGTEFSLSVTGATCLLAIQRESTRRRSCLVHKLLGDGSGVVSTL